MRSIIAATLFTTAIGIGVGTSMPAPQSPPEAERTAIRFDDPERYAKGLDDPARDAWQMPDRVIAALGLGPGDRVADLGAGTGYFSVRLARSAARPSVFAVDIESRMVAYLAKRAAQEGLSNIRVVQATASSPNLPAAVDVMLVVNTFHHIAQRTRYFADVRTSFRPGGRVAIIEFRKDAPGGGPPAHLRFPPEQIVAEMDAAGYALEAQYDFLPRQHFLVFRASPHETK